MPRGQKQGGRGWEASRQHFPAVDLGKGNQREAKGLASYVQDLRPKQEKERVCMQGPCGLVVLAERRVFNLRSLFKGN